MFDNLIQAELFLNRIGSLIRGGSSSVLQGMGLASDPMIFHVVSKVLRNESWN